jgi:surfactin synthase thioesterase subunit
MSDDQLELRILALNEHSPDLMGNRDLVALIIPVMRADMEVVESARFDQEAPLAYPIYAFRGDRDPHVPLAYLEDWKALTAGPFEARLFPGGHFFIRNDLPQIVGSIIARLTI